MFLQQSYHVQNVVPSESRLGVRGPSRGRLGRQKARSEAVLGVRRPVQRPSWAPVGPSKGRLGRGAMLDVFASFPSGSWTNCQAVGIVRFL